MSHEQINPAGSARQQAVVELQQLIQARYPDAVFEVGPGGDDPEGTYITAIVDLDDPDEVMDLVIERLLTFQIEERLPIQVVPIRTPERVAALEQQRASRPHLPASLSSLQSSP